MLEVGEIDQQTFDDTVEGLDIDSKIESYCYVVRNLEAQAEAFKKEKDRLAERERIAKNGIERLKANLLMCLQAVDKKKVDAGTFTVSRSVSKSVKIFDETGIPEEFLVYQPAKIDKTSIAKALKEGKVVAGAEFEEKENVRIR
jgi:hypothetical protein